jgi:hypothetical protein
MNYPFKFRGFLIKHCREGNLKIADRDLLSIISDNSDWNFENDGMQIFPVSNNCFFSVCEKIIALHRYNEGIFTRLFDIENDSFTEEGSNFVERCFYFFDIDNDNMLSVSELANVLKMLGIYSSYTCLVIGKFETIANKLTLKGFKDFFIHRAKKKDNSHNM